MAVVIPLVTDFDGRGIKKAEKAFGELKASSSRLGASIKSAMLPATAAIAGLAAVGYSSIKAAMEDSKAQAMLARQLRQTTNATKAQVAATETFISKLQMATGVADDELRPAFASLVRATRNVGKAQKLLKLSLDVSKGSGKSLNTVVMSISRAYGGNVKALARLEPSLKSFIGKTTTADQATRQLSKLFEGAAATAAGTLQGKFEILKVKLDETKESLGTALFPIAEQVANFVNDKFAPYVQKLVDAFSKDGLSGAVKLAATDIRNFIQDASGFKGFMVDLTLTVAAFVTAFKVGATFAEFIGFIGAIKTAVGALGGVFTTFAATSVGVITSAIGLAVLGVFTLIDALRDPIFRTQFGAFLLDSLKLIGNAFITVHNALATVVNAVTGAYNKLVPKSLEIPKIPTVGYLQFSDQALGINAPDYGTPRAFESGPGGVTINVNGGDPQAVVDTITRWYRQNGSTVPWMR